MQRPKDLPNWESRIDQQIREAQERGEFDDLPGSGQPLDLTPNPYAQDRELAFKVLKDAGYAPEWIELDKAIREKLASARTALARRWKWYTTRLGELKDRSDSWARAERERVQGSWFRAAVAFESEVETINKEIAELNLKVPSPRFQRAKVNAAGEMERVTGRLE
jgi:DnaJ family protein C protein 28